MKTHIVKVDINPWIRRIWIERLPVKLSRHYTGGRLCRSYQHTLRRVDRIWRATYEKGWEWSQDINGYHLQDPNVRQTRRYNNSMPQATPAYE